MATEAVATIQICSRTIFAVGIMPTNVYCYYCSGNESLPQYKVYFNENPLLGLCSLCQHCLDEFVCSYLAEYEKQVAAAATDAYPRWLYVYGLLAPDIARAAFGYLYDPPCLPRLNM